MYKVWSINEAENIYKAGDNVLLLQILSLDQAKHRFTSNTEIKYSVEKFR